ncbi:MAG: DUF4845 domain-containing protein [Methylococcaceae bacterium]
MTYSTTKQKGLTFISIMLILGLIAFFTLLAFKIGPIYLNHNKITTAITDVKNLSNVENMSKHEVRMSLAKRLNMNYADKIKVDDFDIIKRVNYISVELNYERVEKILGNLSVLVEFNESFEAGEGT